MMKNHVAGVKGYWMYMGVSEKVRELGRSKCERVREEAGYRDSAALDRTERKLKVIFFILTNPFFNKRKLLSQ